MKKLIYLSALILASCGGSKEGEETEEATSEDTTTEAVEETVPVDTVPKIEEAETIEEAEAANTGMSFCDCAKKIKTLDDQIMAEEDETKTEALMAEKDKLMDGDCLVMKAGAQNTPAQRAERMRKVNECLGK